MPVRLEEGVMPAAEQILFSEIHGVARENAGILHFDKLRVRMTALPGTFTGLKLGEKSHQIEL